MFKINNPKMEETYGKFEESPREEKEDMKDLNIDINKDDIIGEEEPKDSKKENDNLDINEIKIEEISNEDDKKDDNIDINENKKEEIPEEEDKKEGNLDNIDDIPNFEINELKKEFNCPPPEEKEDIFMPGKEEIPITIIPPQIEIKEEIVEFKEIKDVPQESEEIKKEEKKPEEKNKKRKKEKNLIKVSNL